MREKIVEYLRKTEREGIEDLIAFLDEIEFFTAPASTQFHGCKEGALAEHSFNVLEVADKFASKLYKPKKYKEMYPSIIIAALLHDLGKCGDFDKPMYVKNILKDGTQSDKKPFEINKDLLDIPHEVRSVKLCTLFIDLTEEEEFAILMHNGLYGAFKYMLQGKETELYMIIHFADMWASRVIEKE